jgi:signal transduction histidine kinase
VLDQLGLIVALELIIHELNSRNQVHIKFSVSGKKRRLSNEEELALFRIAQEAISNIGKHAFVTPAEVKMVFKQSLSP